MSEVEITAPMTPYHIDLNISATHFQKTEKGGMILCFTPMMPSPGGGGMPYGPQIRVHFSNKEEWDTFKGKIERDGAMSQIVVPKPMSVVK